MMRKLISMLIALAALVMVLAVVTSVPQAQEGPPPPEPSPTIPPEDSAQAEIYATANDCTAETDLYIGYKELTAGAAVPGGELEYKIYLKNDGNAAAQNIVITDTLPVSVTYVADYNEYGFTTVLTGNTVVWTRPVLNPGESAYLYLWVRLADTIQAGDTLTNTVWITTSDPDIDPSNNKYALGIQAEADMEVSKEVYGTSKAPQGEEMVYKLRFANNGDLDAVDVVITDTLPPSTTFVEWSSNTNVDTPNHELLGRVITPTVNGNRIAWNLGSVDAGDYGYIYLLVRVSDTVTVGETLTNVIQVASALDATPSNDVYTYTIAVYTATRNVEISKSLYSSAPPSGGDIEYRIYFANNTNSNTLAHDVVITDTLPPSTTFVSWSTSPWSTNHDILGRTITPTVHGNQIAWPIGPLLPGQSEYIYVTAHIPDTVPPGTVLTNTVQITMTEEDADDSDNMRTLATTVLTPTRDMHIYKYVSGQAAPPGGEMKYGIRFENQGNSTAHDVVITDTLPLSVTYVSWFGYIYPYSSNWYDTISMEVHDNQVIWHMGEVLDGQYGYIYLTVRVTDTAQVGDTLTNTVCISTSDPDTDPSDNTDIHTVTVASPERDVEVAYKSLDSGAPLTGGEIEYRIKFENSGNASAPNVVITDELPLNVSFVSWYGYTYNPAVDLDETITWTVDGNRIAWYLGTLEAGQYGYIYPTVRVTDTAQVRDVLCNRVRISTTVTDTDPTNNVYTHTATVYYPTYDMHLEKTLYSYLEGAPGGEMEYRIYFKNEGSAPAHDVIITDTLPPNTSFVSWHGYINNPYISFWDETIPVEVRGNQVVWRLGEVEGGQYGRIYAQVRIADTAQVGDVLTNTVQISTSDEEWDFTDNTAILTTTVISPVIDLKVSKSACCTSGPGGEMRYDIEVDNYGNVAATDVVITDTLPLSTTPVSWYLGYSHDAASDITGTVKNGQVIWYVDVISPEGYIIIDLLLHISDTVQIGDTLTNTVEATASETELNPGDNWYIDTTTTVTPTARVQVYKYAPSEAVPGGSLMYSIYFYDDGGAAARDVFITDTLPMSVTYDYWEGTLNGASLEGVVTPTVTADNEVVWHFEAISGCSYGYIYLYAYASETVAVGTMLTNTVEITASNNTATSGLTSDASTTVVSATAMVSLTVTGPQSGVTGVSYAFTATVSPPTATTPIRYEWTATDGKSVVTEKGDTTNIAHFSWDTPGVKTIVVTATNILGSLTDTHVITLTGGPQTQLYLPVVLKNYSP